MPQQIEPTERGQSIILVAIAMLALVIFAGVAVDISHAYVQRRTAQNAADGAALAGARDLTRQRNLYGKHIDVKGKPGEVKAAMNDFGERNGIADSDGVPANEVNAFIAGTWLDQDQNVIGPIVIKPGIKIPLNAYGVWATATITANTFFGGIIGLDGLTLNAEAAVTIAAPACGVSCVVPISTRWYTDPQYMVETESLIYPTSPENLWGAEGTLPLGFTCYNIWNGMGPGNFGWLNWTEQDIYCDPFDDCGEQCLAYHLDPDRCIGFVAINDWVAGGPGTVNGQAVRDQLDKWIGDFENAPKQFTVPVYNDINYEGGCNAAYLVAGFARMQLLGYQLSQGVGAPVRYDPWFAGGWESVCNECINIGVPPDIDPCADAPNNGERLTAVFFEFIDQAALPGDCDIYGTVSTPRMTR
jgi:hypothetical protein